jgi:hypothetical protein
MLNLDLERKKLQEAGENHVNGEHNMLYSSAIFVRMTSEGSRDERGM